MAGGLGGGILIGHTVHTGNGDALVRDSCLGRRSERQLEGGCSTHGVHWLGEVVVLFRLCLTISGEHKVDTVHALVTPVDNSQREGGFLTGGGDHLAEIAHFGGVLMEFSSFERLK